MIQSPSQHRLEKYDCPKTTQNGVTAFEIALSSICQEHTKSNVNERKEMTSKFTTEQLYQAPICATIWTLASLITSERKELEQNEIILKPKTLHK